jgi:hypothetical protein
MVLSWNVTVASGGLPPYNGTVWVMGSASDWLFHNLTGNLTIAQPGTYNVDVYVQDSSCTQLGLADFPVFAWGAPGPHPFDVTVSTNTTTVGSAVQFNANISGLPSGWSVLFTTPQLYSNLSWVDHTFYFPGSYNATACWVDDTSNVYACATSPDVVVTGVAPIVTGATVGPGSGPVTVTFWASVVNTTLLPAGWSLYLYAWNGSAANWTQTTTAFASINETVGCGVPFTPYVPLVGNCTWTAVASLLGPLNGPDLGFLGDIGIVATVPSNGSLSGFYPVGLFSYGPTNGSVPLNVSLNFSLSGGQPLYRYYYSAFGRSSVLANGTPYPVGWGSASFWNGSLTHIVLSLNRTGVYWVQIFLVDAVNNFVDCQLPLVYVGNVTPYVPAPLHIQGGAAGTLNGSGNATVEFVVRSTGGVGPYTVEWAFGDGSFGTSLLGVSFSHRYDGVGVFHPTVTVSDGSGQSVTSSLPTVTVLPIAQTSPGHPAADMARVGFSWNSSVVAGAAVLCVGLITLAAIVVVREVRRQGDGLVAGLRTEDRSAGPPPR